MTGVSWHPGCRSPSAACGVLRVRYWGFDLAAHQGELIVNASAAASLTQAFRLLFEARFPIRQMRVVDDFGGDDGRSMLADNTSAFNCWLVPGTSVWAQHAYGLAVDINPFENLEISGDPVTVCPAIEPYHGALSLPTLQSDRRIQYPPVAGSAASDRLYPGGQLACIGTRTRASRRCAPRHWAQDVVAETPQGIEGDEEVPARLQVLDHCRQGVRVQRGMPANVRTGSARSGSPSRSRPSRESPLRQHGPAGQSAVTLPAGRCPGGSAKGPVNPGLLARVLSVSSVAGWEHGEDSCPWHLGVAGSAGGACAARGDRIGSGGGRAGVAGRGGYGRGRGLAGDGGLRARLCVVVRGRQRPPRPPRRGCHRSAGAGGRDGGPRAARGGGDQRHAHQRPLAGGMGGRAGPARSERPAGPGTQDRQALSRRVARDGLRWTDRDRRLAARGTRRRAPGGWHRDRRGRGP